MIQVKKSTIASTTIIPTIHYKCSPQPPSGSSRSKGGPSKSTISRNKQKEKKELSNQILFQEEKKELRNQILFQEVKDRYETLADPQDLKGPSKSTISRNKQKEKKELSNQILVQAVKDRYETIAISVHHSRHQDPQDLKGPSKSTISRNKQQERKN
ncbi:unnamed protein product [Rhizophagus irregularis]|nr:unnamed protein product [Rhizophagus irregularis]